jgi:hypothetical protein
MGIMLAIIYLPILAALVPLSFWAISKFSIKIDNQKDDEIKKNIVAFISIAFGILFTSGAVIILSILISNYGNNKFNQPIIVGSVSLFFPLIFGVILLGISNKSYRKRGISNMSLVVNNIGKGTICTLWIMPLALFSYFYFQAKVLKKF